MVEYTPDVNIVPQGATEPGIFILPSYTYGASPLSVGWEIHATPAFGEQAVTEYAFDPGDGCPIVKGEFTAPPDGGHRIAIVPHTYIYNKSKESKYTGRTFYPDVTVKTAKGAIKSLNLRQRKACEVWVRDPRFD